MWQSRHDSILLLLPSEKRVTCGCRLWSGLACSSGRAGPVWACFRGISLSLGLPACRSRRCTLTSSVFLRGCSAVATACPCAGSLLRSAQHESCSSWAGTGVPGRAWGAPPHHSCVRAVQFDQHCDVNERLGASQSSCCSPAAVCHAYCRLSDASTTSAASLTFLLPHAVSKLFVSNKSPVCA